MSKQKVSIELSDSDWGKVAVAVDHELNKCMNDWRGISGQRNLSRHVPLCVKIDALARIRQEVKRQRRAIRSGQVTDQSVSKTVAA